jgi:uncharacterized protein YjbI with pentapeptide repeats
MGREVHIKIKEREKEPRMSIQKKSLISALKTTKKANIAKEELNSPNSASKLSFQGTKLQGTKLQGTKLQGTKLQAGKSVR